MEEYRDDEYEKICMICKRPETVTGKQISMPGGITVCPDCMQKTMDQMGSSPLTMQITPEMMENFDYEQESEETDSEKSEEEIDKKKKRKPEVHFINMADLMGGMPNQPKIKKRKPGEKKEPLIQLKDIPISQNFKRTACNSRCYIPYGSRIHWR